MIEYKKTIFDQECRDLLKVYEPEIPLSHFVRGYENNMLSFVKVFYDEKCYGLLVCRAERNRDSELVLVVLHVVAHKNIDVSMHNILGESIFHWARSLKFDHIRQHADRPGLCKMLEKYYDKPSEWVYEKRLKIICPQNQVRVRNSQAIITTTE